MDSAWVCCTIPPMSPILTPFVILPQVLTGTIMANDIGGVEDALRTKLTQTGNLRVSQH